MDFTLNIIQTSREDIEKLKREAAESPRKRAHLLLHGDRGEIVQEMVVALCRGTYLRPHNHCKRIESIYVMEGELGLVVFSGEGSVISRLRLSAQNADLPFLYRIPANAWHCIAPLTESAVIHEITSGPFVAGETLFAPWAPEEGDAAGRGAFLTATFPPHASAL